MRIIIFGPQGSGKGTQAELIARRHNLPYVSTGDIFRYHTKNETELGVKVSQYLSQGELVPEDLTNQVVKSRLDQPDCVTGFVLDGYPRNRKQLDFLNSIFKIDFAIVIELSDDEAVKRLSGRLACKCGLSYHLEYNPPVKADLCDKCGSELFRRDDDQPEAIKKRLAIYHTETEPLFAEFEREDIFYRVDGSRSIDQVYQQIEKVISSNKK
ncbi:MAG: adenylate kinase [Patescibacteria group bacterium]|nr:adenylate kinase [Patescibacteria group bacterium]